MGILVLMRFIQGLSACGLRSTAYAVVRDNTQDSEFGSNMSALYSLVSLSPIMAPFLGGLLVWLCGWRGVFVFLSFFGILVIVCSYFIEDVYRPGQQSSFHLGGILKAMIDSQNWIGGLIFAAGVTSMFCFASSTSYITHQQFGMPHYYIYMSFALIGTMMLFIGHLSNRLFKRFRNDQVFVYGALIIMTSTGLLAFLSWQALINYWWYIGICMMGVSLSALMVGTGMGIGLDGRNQNIGLAIAVISMLGYSIPAALGWVMALNNPDALSFALTISLFYLFVLGLWLFKAQKHR
jgi:DHA1 family bicyclomycin/chloramphenicol resistance-like MFS transporter